MSHNYQAKIYTLPLEIEVPHFQMVISENIDTRGLYCFSVPHTHSYHELFIFSEGDHYLWIDGREYVAHPGDIYVIHPREVHLELGRTLDSPFSKYVIGFFQKPIENNAAAADAVFGAALKMLQHRRKLSLDPTLLPILARLSAELRTSRPGMENTLRALGTLLFTDLLRPLPLGGGGG